MMIPTFVKYQISHIHSEVTARFHQPFLFKHNFSYYPYYNTLDISLTNLFLNLFRNKFRLNVVFIYVLNVVLFIEDSFETVER